MKISYITMQFPVPSETFASNDVKTLKSLGIDIDVYTLKNKDKNYNNLIESRGLEKIKIISGDLSKNILGVSFVFKNIFSFFSLFSWLIKNDFNKPKHLIKMIALMPMSFYIFEKLKKEKPNIVHLFWGHYPSSVGYLVKKNMPDTKLSIFLGAYDLEYALGVSKSLSKSADFIFTHTGANLEQLKSLGIDVSKVTVVHRGTTVSNFLPLIENSSKDKNSWIAAGRLIPLKNFETIIEVFSAFNKKCNDSKLFICGDGILRNKLEESVHSRQLVDNILFKGHVTQKQLLEQMGNADVMILLSSTERLPNVVKEAMLAGCICIVSETLGIDELIEHGVTGFIVPHKDYSKIPLMILGLNEQEKQQIRHKAREFIINNFDVEVSMKKYLEVWQTKGVKYEHLDI